MGFATLRDIPRNAGVHIYGAGGAGRQLKRLIERERSDVTVVNFIDTYKQGTLEGLEIVRLDMLPETGPDGQVLVASTHWCDICRELEQRNFQTPLIFEPKAGNSQEYRWLGARLHRLHREQRLRVVKDTDFPQNAKISILGRDKTGQRARKYINRARPDVQVVSYLTFSAEGKYDGLPVRHVEPGEIEELASMAVLAGDYWEESAVRILNDGAGSAKVYEQFGTIRECVVLEREKIIYVNVPKAASSSLNQAFWDYAGIAVENPHAFVPDGILREIDLRDPAYDDFLKFSVVRHPWDRLLSGFRSKFVRQDEYFQTPYGRELGVREFTLDWFLDLVLKTHDLISDLHWRPQWRLLCDDAGQLLVDKIIRMEDMKDELPAFLQPRGITLHLPHLNATEYITTHRWKHSTECPAKYRELFTAKFTHDFELFGYKL